MCLVITIIMLGFAIQNLFSQNWITGITQLIIAFGFLAFLINNIKKTKCERDGSCYNGCSITNWFSQLIKKDK